MESESRLAIEVNILYGFNFLIGILQAVLSEESTRLLNDIKKSLSFIKQIMGARIETLASIPDIAKTPRVLETIEPFSAENFSEKLHRLRRASKRQAAIEGQNASTSSKQVPS